MPTLPTDWPCLRAHPAGAVLDISVSPNARRTELVGWHDGALRVRLAAPPVDGAANDALRRWLADALGLPQNRIRLIRGETARRKQLQVLEMDTQAVLSWLQQQSVLQSET